MGVSSLSLAKLEAARSAFIGSASAKEILVAAAIASRLTMPLAVYRRVVAGFGGNVDTGIHQVSDVLGLALG